MSHIRRLGSAGATLAIALAATGTCAQTPAGCYAAIKGPAEGGVVALTGNVEGHSSAIGNVAVWVFTHRKGVKDWWPQGGGPVTGVGDWTVQVTYGTSGEAGQPFEIAVIPVDLRTNEGLAGWLARAQAYAEFPGIALPRPAPGCRYNIVDVRRSP